MLLLGLKNTPNKKNACVCVCVFSQKLLHFCISLFLIVYSIHIGIVTESIFLMYRILQTLQKTQNITGEIKKTINSSSTYM